jgi:hypothetical protein
MTYVRSLGGCYAHKRELGLPRSRGGEGSSAENTIAVDVRVFSDELVVEACPSAEWTSLDAVPLHLHRDRVERVELGKGRGLRRWLRFGVVHATFDFVDRGDFDLMVDRERAAELASVLREVYGPRFWA